MEKTCHFFLFHVAVQDPYASIIDRGKITNTVELFEGISDKA